MTETNELETLVQTLHEELLGAYTERINLLTEIRRLKARLESQDVVSPDTEEHAP